MGKAYTIYLNDEEEKVMSQFCEENNMTPYRAIKTAIRELMQIPKPSKVRPLSSEEIRQMIQEELYAVLQSAQEHGMKIRGRFVAKKKEKKPIAIVRARAQKRRGK